MVKHFKLGMFTEFFQLWDEHLSDIIKQEMTTQKLEFKLNVYFAIYPLLKNSSSGNQVCFPPPYTYTYTYTFLSQLIFQLKPKIKFSIQKRIVLSNTDNNPKLNFHLLVKYGSAEHGYDHHSIHAADLVLVPVAQFDAGAGNGQPQILPRD